MTEESKIQEMDRDIAGIQAELDSLSIYVLNSRGWRPKILEKRKKALQAEMDVKHERRERMVDHMIKEANKTQ